MFKRIFIGYLAVLLISFAVLALAFSFTVRQYLINDTVQSLHRVAETLSTSAFDRGIQGSGNIRGAFFKLANRIAYADYVVLRQDGLIMDSSDVKTYPHGVKNINDAFTELAFGEESGENMVKRDLVAVKYPVSVGGEGKQANAALILYTQLDLLAQLNFSILSILALALGAGTFVSLLAGLLVTRVVVKPLHLLKNRASELARRRFAGKLDISTGDELEELADAFNEMSGHLAEYDRSQKEFFRNASHELKTPLMSVQGYAEALKDRVIPDEEKEQSLQLIIRESERMKALVDEFIYLSKMETLQENYSFESFNLSDTVNEAVHSVQSLALEKKVAIETDIIESENNFYGDPEKIHRLLLNILSNAVRCAQNTVKLEVQGNTKIEISDDGIGFEETELEKVFEPFYRGKNGGSGLGLSISQAIVEKHGGKITAGNNPAGGARITIKLPS